MDVENRPHVVEIVAALKEITARITSATDVAQAINDMLKVTADLLPGHIRCGVTLVGQGEPANHVSAETTAAGLILPEQLDEVGDADGDGPSMQAIRTRTVVSCQDLETEQRWPVWSARARRHGVRAVLSYPFDIDGPMLGALNLYADRRDGCCDDVSIIAMLVADHASLLLRARLRQASQDDVLARLEAAMVGDAAVERAVGIVMAQRGCPPDQARRHLHDAAAHLGVGLAVVAERLVQTVSERGTGAIPDQA